MADQGTTTAPDGRLRAVFLDLASVDPGDLDRDVLERAGIDWRFHDETAPEEVATRVAGAGIVVSNKVPLGRDALAQLAPPRLVCIAATGYNNLDTAAAAELGVRACNVRGYATPSVVQHVFALILALTTRLEPYRALVRAGAWQRSRHFCLLDHSIGELAGQTLGIIGYGELGRGVAQAARAFGMEVAIAARPGGPVQPGRLPLDALLRSADVVSLHCPLADNTRNLIGRRELALMKRGALLINTARGGIVDEAALLDALRAGALGGAGVDVLAEEPPVAGNPLLEVELDNLIVTPHIAWASRASRQRLLAQLGSNIDAFLAGGERNRIA